MVIDKENMKSVLEDFPKQCREALSLAKGIKVSAEIDKVVVCGMGGSAIGGSLLKAYMKDSAIPVFVVRNYNMPQFVDDKTLVFAISYSGNTEETLSALTQAKNKNAVVIAITSGGQLADLVDTVIKIPSGLQPRNGVAYLFFPLIGILFNSGIIDVRNSDLNEAIKIVSDTEYFSDKGRDLARKIKEKTPVIYSTPEFEVAAYRFKTQINENAKHPAWNSVLPELCHNEILGYAGMERSKFITFIIKDKEDHERNVKRIEIIKNIFEERVDVEEILSLGESYLARLFSVIYLGDWISFHLAMWKRIDPTPVYVIEELKKALKE